VSRIIRPDLSNWRAGLIVLAFLFASSPPVAAQSSIPNNPGETISRLKRAVVIITTVNRQGKPLLQGSGFFVSADLIVTNLHVIKEAALIRIEMFDGVTRNLQKVVAVNEKADLALLQLERTEGAVEFLQVADSAPAEGEPILVMSNPRGCQWKLTQGEVGPTWQFKDTGKRIQITALILPGSSGGPVVNQEGRVVGIAAMHMEGSDDLNFVVPAQSLRTLQASTGVAILR
jgi:S1-C subfamily serine protease